VIRFQVDNIMATFSFPHSLSLQNLAINQFHNVAKYNCETFPGLFIKYKEGTVILFHSGKVVIVGCRREQDIQCLIQNLIAAIHEK